MLPYPRGRSVLKDLGTKKPPLDMDKHGGTDAEKTIRSEMKTDVDLLLECLKFQNEDSSTHKQAVITLSSICSYNGVFTCAAAACKYLKECGGLYFIQQLAWSNPHKDVTEVILFFLGRLVENNVFCKQWLCTSSLLTRASSLLKDSKSSRILKKSASYLLLALLTNNNRGQSLARTSNCLNTMLSVFSGLPSEIPRHGNRDSEEELSHWSDLARALCASVNNPQHEENQNMCASVLPSVAESLTLSSSPGIVASQCSFITGVVSNNAFCQEQFARSGGLSALAQVLSRFTLENNFGPTNFPLAVTITKTIDVCVTDQTKLAFQLSKHCVVPHMVALLLKKPHDVNSKLAILITIGHATEECVENQRQLLESHGLPLLVQMMVEAQDEEISKAATFILQSCIKLTNTYVKSAMNELIERNVAGNSQLRTHTMPHYMVDMLKEMKTRKEQMFQEQGSSEGDLASLQMVKDVIDSKLLQWQSTLTTKQSPTRNNMKKVLLSVKKMSNQQEQNKNIVSLLGQQHPCQSEESSAKVNQTAYVGQPNGIAERRGAVLLTRWEEPCMEAQHKIPVDGVKAALPVQQDTGGFVKPMLPLRSVGQRAERETPRRLPQSASFKRKLQFEKQHADEENVPLPVKKQRVEQHQEKEDNNLREYSECSRNYENDVEHSNSQLDLMAICKEAFDEEISSKNRSPILSCSQRCAGCITDSSLNSKSYHSIVQKCGSLCTRHHITMELEKRYKVNHSKACAMHRSRPYNNITLTPRIKRPERSDLVVTPQKTIQTESSFHQVKATTEGGVKRSPSKNKMDAYYFSSSDSHSKQDIDFSYVLDNSEDKKHKQRSNFTNHEVTYLQQGVDKFGHCWNQILWSYPFQKGRTNVQLAKKYKQLKEKEVVTSAVRSQNPCALDRHADG
ncbi:telomere repeats-binding bouquet formation protein 1 isoform X5 [Lethenteron reissneri]|uniref:telomere repeats-binding bouquet formation protein 1 isoform X5 n=1 Tax=Lethenteron reissneri TaxID=7753 RepID=UPI002AB6A7BD|nr:telomere repeats-binding bouquet formation protein 1 isoform X5 [Lethenteron reissneri]